MQLVMIIGIILTCVSSVWLCIVAYCRLNSLLIVISAVCLGAACAVLLVSAISMATEMIGSYSVCFCYHYVA